MKYILGILALALATQAHAQADKEEREEKKALARQKVEYNVFRRQILTLAEYTEERKKIPQLQKAAGMPVKLLAWVDSTADADNAKTLTGFISESVGDNATDIFVVTYDRALKRITAVKPTGETVEIEKDADAKARKGAAKPKAGKAEDEDEEEKPVKARKRIEDEEDDE